MENKDLLELYPTVEDLPTERADIEEIATNLEVSFRSNTSDKTILERIADVLYLEDEELEGESETDEDDDSGDDEELESFMVVNKRKNKLSIKGVEIESKGNYTLSAQDLKNDILMKKINHAIETGVLKKV